MADWFSSVDLGHILTSVLAFAAGLIVKTMLDFKIAYGIVKWFSWIKPRFILGEDPHALAGTWSHVWGAGGSEAFALERDRHDHARIKQLGRYVYAESIYKGKTYGFFGKVIGQHLDGEWFDIKDKNGYRGMFQVRIVNSARMEGRWMGYAQTSTEIRHDFSQWSKVFE